jgi:hypothetical protein
LVTDEIGGRTIPEIADAVVYGRRRARVPATVVLMAALIPLSAAVVEWIKADAERKRVEAAKAEEFRAWDRYGEYIADRLARDEALARAIRSLNARLESAREDCGPPMDFRDTPRAARRRAHDWPNVDLDEVARRHGYKP